MATLRSEHVNWESAYLSQITQLVINSVAGPFQICLITKSTVGGLEDIHEAYLIEVTEVAGGHVAPYCRWDSQWLALISIAVEAVKGQLPFFEVEVVDDHCDGHF